MTPFAKVLGCLEIEIFLMLLLFLFSFSSTHTRTHSVGRAWTNFASGMMKPAGSFE